MEDASDDRENLQDRGKYYTHADKHNQTFQSGETDSAAYGGDRGNENQRRYKYTYKGGTTTGAHQNVSIVDDYSNASPAQSHHIATLI